LIILCVISPTSPYHFVVMTGISPDGNTLYVKDPGNNLEKYDISKVINGRLYELSPGVKFQKTQKNLNVVEDDFDTSSLNYQNCYYFSQLYKSS